MLHESLKNDQPDDGGDRPRVRLMNAKDYFTDPQPSTAIKETKRVISERLSRELLNPATVRDTENWELLGNRAIGAEGDYSAI